MINRICLLLSYHVLFPSPSQIEGFTTPSRRKCTIKTNKTFLKVSNEVSNEVSNSNESIKTKDDTIYYAPTVIEKDGNIEEINKTPTSSNTNEYSFFDEAIIYIRAGSGGQGSPSYKKIGQNKQKGVGDGGNGGNGGDIYLVLEKNLNNLAKFNIQSQRVNAYGGGGGAAKKFQKKKNWLFSMSFRAEKGCDGGNRFRDGGNGEDLYVKVPSGTLVEEVISNSTSGDEEYETSVIGTIDDNTPKLLVGKGGEGGEGSGVKAENSNKKRGGLRITQSQPTSGERRVIKLTLQILADVALVGVPNAGKSTFLASVTKAKPKIANYPFTTVIPNLGVWVSSKEEASLVLCDVPGLIRGASRGTGLGHAFLRHLERCHVILHIIDATSTDPIHDYTMLNNELVHYKNGLLANMPQVVIINKIDKFDASRSSSSAEDGLVTKRTMEEITRDLEGVVPHSRIMYISAKENEGVEEVMFRLYGFVQKVKRETENN